MTMSLIAASIAVLFVLEASLAAGYAGWLLYHVV
jgi:hypothetical protein